MVRDYVADFLENRSIKKEIELNEYVEESINILEDCDSIVRDSIYKNLDFMNSKNHFAIMFDMYERSYEYVCGSLSLLVVGQLQSCEASCRTAIEGAVNLHFVSLGDSMGKIISYFRSHFEIEKKQNKNWRDAIDSAEVDEDAKEHHRVLIDGKNEALNGYESLLKKAMSDWGINIYDFDPKWPNTYEKFRMIGDEIGYRTVYAALCSQSHNDPEDLLNHFVCRAFNNEGFTSAKKVEQYFFSVYMVLQAVKYHVMASAMYLGQFNISCSDLANKFNQALEVMDRAMKKKEALVSELSEP